MSIETPQNPTERLFRSLAERFHDENSLSNFTFALAKAVPQFAKFICEFFDIQVLDDDLIEVEREVTLGDTSLRVDMAFVFENGRKRFFLENKIWDREYHIEEYAKAVGEDPDTSFGIISNHWLPGKYIELAKQKNWKVRYWDKFIDCIQPSVYGSSQSLIEGYVTYVKEVCVMRPIREIRFNKEALVSLYYFNNLVEKVIRSSYQSSLDYRIIREACGRSWSGILYALKRSISSKEIKAWFGIDYDDEEPVISVSLHWDWNPDMETYLRQMDRVENDYFEMYPQSNKFSFRLSQAKYREFLEAVCEKQQEILQSFFGAVNAQLIELLDK
jgi:hypothetical protein